MHSRTRSIALGAVLGTFVLTTARADVDWKEAARIASERGRKAVLQRLEKPWRISTRTMSGAVQGALPREDPEKALEVVVTSMRLLSTDSGSVDAEVDVSFPVKTSVSIHPSVIPAVKFTGPQGELEAEGTFTMKVSLRLERKTFLSGALEEGKVRGTKIERAVLVLSPPSDSLNAEQRFKIAEVLDLIVRLVETTNR